MKTLPALFLFCLCFIAAINAQTPGKGTARISGRVTVTGKPLERVLVVLLPAARNGSLPESPLAQTSTDNEGNYTLANLPAGRYDVTPRAPAYIVTNTKPRETYVAPLGQAITVKDGEEAKDVDFTMLRGGVITGRVTDANGRPVIREGVFLTQVDEKSGTTLLGKASIFGESATTDDRGVYRAYGLPPGRYLVGVGVEGKRGGYSNNSSFLKRTYAPGTPDEKAAKTFELAAGQEIVDANIKTGLRQNTYQVRGRALIEETRQVASDSFMEVATVDDDGQENFFFSGAPVSPKGDFTLPRLLPGRYRVNAQIYRAGNEYVAQPVTFEVKDADISDLEVFFKPGLSIEGVIVLENTSSRPAPPLTEFHIQGSNRSKASPVEGRSAANPAPDGSFRLGGLQPGAVSLAVGRKDDNGVYLLRVERDGVAQKNRAIEVAPGQSVTGVRLVCAYATGVIRGRINVENGPLPAAAKTKIRIERADGQRLNYDSISVDDSQNFRLEGLLPGEYELTVTVTLDAEGSNPPRLWRATQKVYVTSDTETETIIKIDAAQEEKQP